MSASFTGKRDETGLRFAAPIGRKLAIVLDDTHGNRGAHRAHHGLLVKGVTSAPRIADNCRERARVVADAATHIYSKGFGSATPAPYGQQS